jgi:polyisoprenoid-binding protein YceI
MKWVIDSSPSLVEFSVKHMMISTVKGSSTGFEAVIQFDDDAASDDLYSVKATIDATTVYTCDPRRDANLKSANFFDVDHYPTITFESTKVHKLSNGEFRVIGNLTIHGVTKEVVLEVEYSGTTKSPSGQTIAGFTARTNLNRKDFGLNWNVALEAGGVMVSDKVNITLEIEAILHLPATAKV